MCPCTPLIVSLPLHLTLYTLHSTPLYLLLRFLSLVPYIYTPCQRPRKNQRRTKDEPKSAKLQNVRFIKIAISFTSLIPSPIPPTDDRENSERTPTEDLMTKKALFLRLSPRKVVSLPKTVDYFPETVDLSA